MNDVSAIVQAVPAKYKAYFGPDSAFAKLPSLALNTPGELFALVAALLSLEQVDVQALLKVAPGTAKSPPAFGEFDSVGSPLTYQQMRRVWLRRMAVSLWSDANGHWHWSLKDAVMTLDQWDLLLGWNPESDELDDPNSAGFIATAGGFDSKKADTFQGLMPGLHPKSIATKNGNYIFQTTGGQFHFSALWHPDPFGSWHIAWAALRPLLGQQTAPGKFVGQQMTAENLLLLFDSFPAARDGMSQVPQSWRFSAMLATTNYLRGRGYSHPSDDAAKPGLGKEIWPSAGAFAPTYASNVDIDPNTTCSFSDIWSSGFGLCHHTGPLVLSLLRSMNVPARVCFVRIPNTHADTADEAYTTSHVLARAVEPGSSGFMQPNHITLVADIADARVAVYHADDICSYHANRFADAGFTWLPLDRWLSTARLAALAQAAALDPSIAYAIDDDGGKWPFGQIVRLRETQTRANLAGMSMRIAQFPWSSWLGAYLFAVNANDPTLTWGGNTSGLSWIARWQAAHKPGGGSESIASVAADFFELDTQAILAIAADPGIGKYGHWGATRFPINWYSGDLAGSGVSGLAADPQAQQWIAQIALTLEILAAAGKSVGGP